MKTMLSKAIGVLFALLAWVVSALLSLRLFLELGTDLHSRLLLGALALTLEAGKFVALWQWRTDHRRIQGLLALVLAGLSLVASTGSALELLNGRRQAQDRVRQVQDVATADQARLEQGLVLLDQQVRAVLSKLEDTPADWAGTVRSLRQELEVLRVERAALVERLGGNQAIDGRETAQADMFMLLAQATMIPVETLTLGFLFLVALCLEAVIMTTVPDHKGHAGGGIERKEVPGNDVSNIRQDVNQGDCNHKGLLHFFHLNPEEEGTVVPVSQRKGGSILANPGIQWGTAQVESPEGANSNAFQPGPQNMSQREFRPRGKGIPPANNRLEAGKHRRTGRPPKRLDIDRLLPAFSDRILSSMDDRGVASVSRDQVAQELGLTSWAGKILYRLAVEQGSIQAKGRRTVRGDLVM